MIHSKTSIFAYSSNDIWSYLLRSSVIWPPVIWWGASSLLRDHGGLNCYYYYYIFLIYVWVTWYQILQDRTGRREKGRAKTVKKSEQNEIPGRGQRSIPTYVWYLNTVRSAYWCIPGPAYGTMPAFYNSKPFFLHPAVDTRHNQSPCWFLNPTRRELQVTWYYVVTKLRHRDVIINTAVPAEQAE